MYGMIRQEEFTSFDVLFTPGKLSNDWEQEKTEPTENDRGFTSAPVELPTEGKTVANLRTALRVRIQSMLRRGWNIPVEPRGVGIGFSEYCQMLALSRCPNREILQLVLIEETFLISERFSLGSRVNIVMVGTKYTSNILKRASCCARCLVNGISE